MTAEYAVVCSHRHSACGVYLRTAGVEAVEQTSRVNGGIFKKNLYMVVTTCGSTDEGAKNQLQGWTVPKPKGSWHVPEKSWPHA